MSKELLRSIDTSRIELGSAPRVHPNGFLQLDLGDNLRLHVWDDLLPRQEVATPIHDHAFGFRSKVYLGGIVNITYSVLASTGRAGNYTRWYVAHSQDSEETQLRESDVAYIVRPMSRQEILPGQNYELLAAQFHESRHLGRSLTVIQKLGYLAGHRASVMVPVGAVPDNGFRREAPDVGQLWDLVYETAHMLDGTQDSRP